MWTTIRIGEKTAKINTDFIALLYPDDHAIVVTSGKAYVLPQEDYNEIEKVIFPTRKKVAKTNEHAAELLTKLNYLVGGKQPPLISPKRLKALATILAIDGMTEDKLIIAATNLGQDKWQQGENDRKTRYGDLDFLLRIDKATKYAEMTPQDKRKKMF